MLVYCHHSAVNYIFCPCSCEVYQEAAAGRSQVSDKPSQDGEDGYGEHLSVAGRSHQRLEVHQSHYHEGQLHLQYHQLYHRRCHVCPFFFLFFFFNSYNLKLFQCAIYLCDYFAVFRPEARDRMNREFLSDPSYNYEAVNRASKACGPLVLWAIAQVCAGLC